MDDCFGPYRNRVCDGEFCAGKVRGVIQELQQGQVDFHIGEHLASAQLFAATGKRDFDQLIVSDECFGGKNNFVAHNAPISHSFRGALLLPWQERARGLPRDMNLYQTL